ncbi:MAG: hypothetical protein WAN03_02735 [Candidatus Sulfotelmatobacter sp.]
MTNGLITEATLSSGDSEPLQWSSSETVEPAPTSGQPAPAGPHQGWSLENFAREQIRGLVRQVFFSSLDHTIRQVVFSAVDPETEVLSICRRVGEALASETQESIAVVGGFPKILEVREIQSTAIPNRDAANGSDRLRQLATKVRGNLWWVPNEAGERSSGSASSLHAHLSQVRREFDYSIVQALSAAESPAAMAMSQFADGIILVLSARYTRRAVARKIKDSLEGARARILGTVLSDRVFPIPQAIYRRL